MTDRRWMRLALSLGRRGQGRCWPNPAVGCVIVKHGRVVGRGHTADGGRPHAEPLALRMAGAAAAGAVAYVTLEPCAHHGKTPPCAAALIAAGIARVVIALEDPDPRVSGRGSAMLRAAGIEVTTGICADEARRDHAGFLRRVTLGRPAVTLKLATSYDGRIATASGESRWITGPEARRFVHAERARHDAVLVGGGTARSDDPDLTVRELGVTRQPVRIVLTRKAELSLESRLARSADQVPVWLLHGKDAPDAQVAAWEARGARCLLCPSQGRQIPAEAALMRLGQEGLTRIFCEGGGALAASLLGGGLVDRLLGMTAGKVLGAEGVPAIGAMGLEALAEAPRFTLSRSWPLGADLAHEWHPVA